MSEEIKILETGPDGRKFYKTPSGTRVYPTPEEIKVIEEKMVRQKPSSIKGNNDEDFLNLATFLKKGLGLSDEEIIRAQNIPQGPNEDAIGIFDDTPKIGDGIDVVSNLKKNDKATSQEKTKKGRIKYFIQLVQELAREKKIHLSKETKQFFASLVLLKPTDAQLVQMFHTLELMAKQERASPETIAHFTKRLVTADIIEEEQAKPFLERLKAYFSKIFKREKLDVLHAAHKKYIYAFWSFPSQEDFGRTQKGDLLSWGYTDGGEINVSVDLVTIGHRQYIMPGSVLGVCVANKKDFDRFDKIDHDFAWRWDSCTVVQRAEEPTVQEERTHEDIERNLPILQNMDKSIKEESKLLQKDSEADIEWTDEEISKICGKWTRSRNKLFKTPSGRKEYFAILAKTKAKSPFNSDVFTIGFDPNVLDMNGPMKAKFHAAMTNLEKQYTRKIERKELGVAITEFISALEETIAEMKQAKKGK